MPLSAVRNQMSCRNDPPPPRGHPLTHALSQVHFFVDTVVGAVGMEINQRRRGVGWGGGGGGIERSHLEEGGLRLAAVHECPHVGEVRLAKRADRRHLPVRQNNACNLFPAGLSKYTH